MTLNKLSNKRNQPQTIIPNILGKNGSFFKRDTEFLREIFWGRQWTVTETRRKTEIFFFEKLSLKRKTRIFCDWIKSPISCQVSRQNTQRQNSEKIFKFFSQLEDLPARESRAEWRKSLCTPYDWTLYSRTSHQN